MNKDALLELGLSPVWHLRAVPHRAPALVEPPPSATDTRSALSLDWDGLHDRVSGCTACGLHRTRTQTVFGVGVVPADWLFVGEAPGAEEDARGEPFVGQAGRLLDAMLASIDLKRGENVYIANVIKCRPPGNRNPEPGEIAQCQPYLTRQAELISPKLIVTLGRFAAQTLLGETQSISKLRGVVHRFAGTPVIVTYHPAYLLRNLDDKRKAWEDLCFARRTMRELQHPARPAPVLG